MISRGKEFEKNFEKSVKCLIKEGFNVTIDRLYDVIGKKTIEQPADYICYNYPNQIYVECKSTHDNLFSYYTQPQYERLIEKSKIEGVKAGMLIWFVSQKRVFWADIDWLQAYYMTSGVKSVSPTKLESFVKLGVKGIFEVEQHTTRINPEMRLESLFNYITQDGK